MRLNPPPEAYHDIAHGQSKGILWIYCDERVQTSPTSSGTHASIWGDDVARKCWRGRYEPETNRLSVAPPERLLSSPTPPQHLIDHLEVKFGQVEMYSFNPKARRVTVDSERNPGRMLKSGGIMLNITYVITEDPESPGTLLVNVPSLPGCHTFGRDIKEAHANAVDAIQGHLEMLDDLGLPLPHEIEAVSVRL